MAYQGYLIKVGDFIISGKDFIKADSYNATLIIQDLDSYRDMEGVLHRTALKHKVNKIEFETRAMLTNFQMENLLSNIRRNYVNESERKVLANVYVPEINDYMTQEMYLADLQFKIYGVLNGIIYYEPVRFAFIAY